MNRYLRRLRRFGKSTPVEQSSREPAGTEAARFDRARTQEVASVRAKNSRHGKVTADKWNQ